MRSYTYIIILLLSVSALAQDATITISYGETTENPVNLVLGPNTLTAALDIPPKFVKTVTADVTLACCYTRNLIDPWRCRQGQDASFTYCGTINLCVKYDQETTQECKPIENKQKSIITFSPNKQVSKFIFSYTGTRDVVAASTQFTITKVATYGGRAEQIIRSLPSLRGPAAIFLGLVREKIEVGTYTGSFLVSSNEPRALAWFHPTGGISAVDRTTTPNFDDEIHACLDSDTNKLCDYDDETLCSNQDKDWYNGDCCHDAPFNPESETPPNECQWYDTRNNKEMNAVCGKDDQGKWKWAALGDVGLINTLSGSCPSMQIVSDGTGFHTCSTGSQTVIPTNLVTQLTGKLTILGHEYFCQAETIIECGGITPYSPTAKQIGASTTYENKKHYCTADGKWATSLDNAGKDSCVAAGLRWTGTKCCGETDDPLKTYDDPYTGQGTAGACYNNQFIASGSFFSGTKDIINYRGTFAICDPTLPPGTNTTTTAPEFTGTTITPRAYGPCGIPLQQAILTGTMQHIVCTPSGDWQFTSKTEPHLVKQTLWMPSEVEDKQGCCPENQCWDGQQCKDIGYYYDKIIGKGYRCE